MHKNKILFLCCEIQAQSFQQINSDVPEAPGITMTGNLLFGYNPLCLCPAGSVSCFQSLFSRTGRSKSNNSQPQPSMSEESAFYKKGFSGRLPSCRHLHKGLYYEALLKSEAIKPDLSYSSLAHWSCVDWVTVWCSWKKKRKKWDFPLWTFCVIHVKIHLLPRIKAVMQLLTLHNCSSLFSGLWLDAPSH